MGDEKGERTRKVEARVVLSGIGWHLRGEGQRRCARCSAAWWSEEGERRADCCASAMANSPEALWVLVALVAALLRLRRVDGHQPDIVVEANQRVVLPGGGEGVNGRKARKTKRKERSLAATCTVQLLCARACGSAAAMSRRRAARGDAIIAVGKEGGKGEEEEEERERGAAKIARQVQFRLTSLIPFSFGCCRERGRV